MNKQEKELMKKGITPYDGRVAWMQVLNLDFEDDLNVDKEEKQMLNDDDIIDPKKDNIPEILFKEFCNRNPHLTKEEQHKIFMEELKGMQKSLFYGPSPF